MENETKTKQLPEGILPAGYGKVTLAFLIDVVFMIAMMVGLYYAIGSPVILANNGLSQTIDAQMSYIRNTGLMDQNGDRFALCDFPAVESGEYGYEKYMDRVHSYFFDSVYALDEYEINVALTLPSGRSVPKYEGNDAQSYGKWVYETFYRTDFEHAEEAMFLPPLMEDGVTYDYTKKPVLGPSYTAEANAEALRNAFYLFNDSIYSGIYVDTVIGHFSAQPRLAQGEAKITELQWMGFLPSFLASPIIFLFAIPAFSKKGKTLGKLIMRISLVGTDGFRAKRWRILVHYGILTLMFLILALPYQNIVRFGLVLLLMVDFSVFMLGRKNQSLHDKIAGTLHIDDTKTEFFEDEQAYLAFQNGEDPIEADVEEGENA